MLWGVPMGAARGWIGVLVVVVRREDKAMRRGVGRCIVREVLLRWQRAQNGSIVTPHGAVIRFCFVPDALPSVEEIENPRTQACI